MNTTITTRIFTTVFFSVFFFCVLSTGTSFFVHAQNGEQKADIVVEAVSDSSIAHMLKERVQNTWPWYLTRASGLVAGFLLVILMISGTGFITGSTFRFLEPITAWATHRALGIALVLMVTIHIVALYFDEFVHFDVQSLLIPFVSDLRPVELFGFQVGSLYVALGIFALYLFIAIVGTSLLWIDKKPTTWKAIHVMSYLAMVFVFVHALYLGTDLAGGVMRYLWIGAGVLVLISSLQRLWRVKTV